MSLTKCCKFVNMTAGFYAFLANLHNFRNRPFPSCLEPSNGSEDNCRVFVMKTSFHSYTNKANFRMKSFPPSLAFVMRFTEIRKWSIWRNLRNSSYSPNSPKLSNSSPWLASWCLANFHNFDNLTKFCQIRQHSWLLCVELFCISLTIWQHFAQNRYIHQERMKVREVIPHIGPIPIVIPLKLFLDLPRDPVSQEG